MQRRCVEKFKRMAGIQAVDLDSILDEFEFKQNEAEKEVKPENSQLYGEQGSNEGTWSQHGSNTVEVLSIYSARVFKIKYIYY